MAPVNEPANERKSAAAGGESKGRGRTFAREGAREGASPDLVAFTIDAGTGHVVQVEGVDAAGARHELTDDEKASLAKKGGKTTLEEIVEQAFEAGVGCIFGDEGGEREVPDSEEEAELRQVLLQSLIKRSAARRLMQRDVLSRAIVGSLIKQAAGSRRPPKQEGPAH